MVENKVKIYDMIRDAIQSLFDPNDKKSRTEFGMSMGLISAISYAKENGEDKEKIMEMISQLTGKAIPNFLEAVDKLVGDKDREAITELSNNVRESVERFVNPPEGEDEKALFNKAKIDLQHLVYSKNELIEKVPVEAKVEYIKKAIEAGHTNIEFGSFVSPKWIPQMANTAEVMKELLKLEPFPKDVKFSSLIPNEMGMDNFLKVFEENNAWDKLENFDMAIFTSASDEFESANLGRTRDISIKNYQKVMDVVKKVEEEHGYKIPVRGYVSASFVCPVTKISATEHRKTDPAEVIKTIKDLTQLGVDQISLGDTTGHATPEGVEALIKELEKLEPEVPKDKIVWHFHDTHGKAKDNLKVALKAGYRNFDGSPGGLGGCNYAEKQVGNISIEDILMVVEEINKEGEIQLEVDIDPKKQVEASSYIIREVQKIGIDPTPSNAFTELKARHSEEKSSPDWRDKVGKNSNSPDEPSRKVIR